MISVIDKPKMNESLYTDSQKKLDDLCAKYDYEPDNLFKGFPGYYSAKIICLEDGIDLSVLYRKGELSCTLKMNNSSLFSVKEIDEILTRTNKFIKELEKFDFESLPSADEK